MVTKCYERGKKYGMETVCSEWPLNMGEKSLLVDLSPRHPENPATSGGRGEARICESGGIVGKAEEQSR